MSSFEFNKVYIIESLKSNELKTGEELYNDFMKWVPLYKKMEIEIVLKKVNSKKEFFKLLDEIEKDCIDNENYPILHLEIHGNDAGLVLNSGEQITWEEIYESLVKINLAIGNNLFLTLAVCHGAYLMKIIKLDKPAPFFSIVGSFGELLVSDIQVDYRKFYEKLFDTLDVNEAIKELRKSNETPPYRYRYLDTENIFKDVYNNYLKDNMYKEAMKKRAKKAIEQKILYLQINNRACRRKNEKLFIKELKRTKEIYEKNHRRIFFMIDRFPENKERFNIK